MICGDNTAAIGSATREMSGKKMKHLEMGYHLVRDHVESGELKIVYVKTQVQIADIFTKALSRILFERFARLLRGNAEGKSLFDDFIDGILSKGKYLKAVGNEIILET